MYLVSLRTSHLILPIPVENECGLLNLLFHDFVVLDEATLVLIVKLHTLALR